MLKVRVMPCLLIDQGELIKTIKFKTPSYIGDPINAIKIYNEKEVDELIILDISATVNNSQIQFEKLQEITNECFMPMAYGGGIKDFEDVKRLFKIGIEKIIINSYSIENPDFIKKISEHYGSQSVVIAIDAKKNIWGNHQVYSHSGKKEHKLNPVEHAQNMERYGAGEIFINSIDKDGTWEGFDINLIKKVALAVNLPVIACGGAGSIDHIAKAVNEGGASAVAIGSMAVFQKKGMGVLINFPSQKILEKIFN